MDGGNQHIAFLVYQSIKCQLNFLYGTDMATLAELIAQKEALEKQIEQTRRTELKEAIAQVKIIIESYSLTVHDLFGKAKATKKSTGTVAAKYRDPQTGATWSGRGRSPKWLEGKNATDYLIA
jgi:DNA-binding protein H-NS